MYTTNRTEGALHTGISPVRVSARVVPAGWRRWCNGKCLVGFVDPKMGPRATHASSRPIYRCCCCVRWLSSIFKFEWCQPRRARHRKQLDARSSRQPFPETEQAGAAADHGVALSLFAAIEHIYQSHLIDLRPGAVPRFSSTTNHLLVGSIANATG